jgi:hypothetical protein
MAAMSISFENNRASCPSTDFNTNIVSVAFTDSRNILINICYEECLYDLWYLLSLSWQLPLSPTFSCAYHGKFIWLRLYHAYVMTA